MGQRNEKKNKINYGMVRRWRRRGKRAEKNKSEHLVSALAFITSPTPVVHKKASPQGLLVLRSEVKESDTRDVVQRVTIRYLPTATASIAKRVEFSTKTPKLPLLFLKSYRCFLTRDVPNPMLSYDIGPILAKKRISDYVRLKIADINAPNKSCSFCSSARIKQSNDEKLFVISNSLRHSIR